ncbi:MAG: pilC [Clostridiales bacterium]|jgi:type IV pilus assembly protein PilC|nr:pilC [Clostridiales bacterium]
MPLYEYEAKSTAGDVIKGKMESADELVVVDAVRKMGYFPMKVKAYKPGLNIDLSEFKRVTIKDISIFCRQLSVIITSGISILRGLEIVRQQTENPKLKKDLGVVLDDVQRGNSLSTAMAKHKGFPSMLINMIEIGETSGTLDKIMDRMASYFEKEYKLSQKIKQAMTYPIVIAIVAVGVVTFLVTNVIPTFVGMLTSSGVTTLPLPTRIVIGLSDFIRYKWYVIVFFIILFSVLFYIYRKSPTGRFALDKFKLGAPIFGKINKKILTSRFARTFGILMGSGVPLMQSLVICSNIAGNIVIKNLLDFTSEQVKKGAGIGDTLESQGVFPVMLTQMIKIGEESGTLDEVLTKTSDFYDNEVDTATAQLTSMIEPVIIVVLGIVVGFIILSIILPMFEMYNSVAV